MTTNGTGAGSSDVVLGQDAGTGQDVALGFAARPLGVAVIGQTGFGKTTLLEQLIRQDIEEGTACVVFDIEGGLSDRVLAFASTSQRLAKRVLLAEVGEGSAKRPFGVNLYECPDPTNENLLERTVSGVVELLKRLWGEDLTRQPIVSRGIHNSARTIIANPGYTIAEVPLLFEEPALRRQLLANLPEADYPAVHRYWRHYANLREQDRQVWSGATINKLEEFLSNRIVSRIVCQSRTTIPWRQLREEGCCLLLRFPQGVSGGETAATFLG